MNYNVPLTISSWSLGDRCGFVERCDAAAAAGFAGIGLRAETYVDARNEGYSDRELLQILEERELRVTEVEYIVQWAEKKRSYEQMFKEETCFHMCRLFGVHHVNCGLMERYSVEETAERLKALCHRGDGIRIGIEPMPYSGIPDVVRGWEILKKADHPNAGLLLDSWHWMRADTVRAAECLKEIPPERILSVQFNDVQNKPYAAAVLRDESMHDRLAPGEGYGDTEGFLRLLHDHGIRPLVMAVEVISDEILARGVKQTAEYLYRCAAPMVEKIWNEPIGEGMSE